VSVEEIDRALRSLEQRGLVEKTGEFREEQPVWAFTEYYKHLEETAPEILELMLLYRPIKS
jgi:hypothetical protein